MSDIHLVTGGCGYFGGVLVRKLREAGAEVRVFDIHEGAAAPGIEYVRGDIRDAAAVARACEGATTVYHNVALVPLAKDRRAFWDVNYEGTRILLEACRDAGVGKIVHTSSSAVYGLPQTNPVTELSEPVPREDYGRAKLAAEKLCQEFAARGHDVTIVRPRTIMGHGRLGIMQILFEWVWQGRRIPVLGAGGNLYQFVHADDLAAACILAARRRGSRAYNIGTQDFCSMRETLEGLVAHAATGSTVVSVPVRIAELGMKLTSGLGLSPLGPYHALMYGRSLYFDTTRAEQELGWSSRFGNVEMMCQSYDWYVHNRDEVLNTMHSSPHRSSVRQGILALFSRLLSLL